jgi:hypothetical protein
MLQVLQILLKSKQLDYLIGYVAGAADLAEVQAVGLIDCLCMQVLQILLKSKQLD